MGSLITTQDLDIDIAVGEVKKNIIKIAKAKGAENITQSEIDEEVAAFSKSIPTDNKFNHATNTVLFGKETYAQTLTKPNSITQEMFIAINGENQLGLTDTDDEEGVGLGDLTDKVNMAIMRRELLNPKNPAARKIFLNYYEQSLKNVAKDAGGQYTPPNSTTTTKTTNNNKLVEQFENGDKQIQIDQYTVAVRQLGGKYVIVKNSEVSLDHSDLQQFDANDLIKRFGGTVVEQETDEEISEEEFKKKYGYQKPTELVTSFRRSGELDE